MSVAAPELVGSRSPTIHLAPPRVSTSGPEIVDLAAQAGLVLDPWQRDVLCDAMGEREDGNWAAFEAAVIVGRQNGKSAIFEARMLAGLFLLDEELIIYSAHEFKTAQEIFRRMEELVTGHYDFRRRVKAVSRSKGDEGIELTTRQRLRFVARSTGSGRGFSGDCNIWDECQILGEAPVDALMPTMSARRNPQLWYGGSAPDKDLAPCEQISRVRRRALDGAESLAYAEWSAELCSAQCGEGCKEHDDPADPRVWAKTNPGLGIRIDRERIEREHDSMSAKGFARERLSVGNYVTETEDQWAVISHDAWSAIEDALSEAAGAIMFAVDTTPERNWSSIATAGARPDGLTHGELIDHRPGTGWLVERAVQLDGKWKPLGWVIDPAGPAGSLIPEFGRAGLNVLTLTAREAAQACGQFYDAVVEREGNVSTLRCMPHPALNAALAGAQKRRLADAWAWDRKATSVDISPLVALTDAMWGWTTREEEEKPPPPATAPSAPTATVGNMFRPTGRLTL